ncbi:MAG: zinc-ribbon and DUF3426 domain-containing protein [Gallionella sp.]
MDGTTRCPHCDTRFKIAAAQLQAHQGQVRCGHCLTPFDARNEFVADEPNLLQDIPAVNPPSAPLVEALPAANHSLDFSPPPAHAAPQENPEAASFAPLDSEPSPSTARPRTVLLTSLIVVLLALLIVQFSYRYRADLSARLPASQVALQQLCRLLECRIALPQNSDLISIESSNLEADPSNTQLIALTVLLRNHANYVLALPNLELTLNDAQERPLSRRIFLPSEYLQAEQKSRVGLSANQELNIKLWLQLDNINPNGYRLVLIYPNPE